MFSLVFTMSCMHDVFRTQYSLCMVEMEKMLQLSPPCWDRYPRQGATWATINRRAGYGIIAYMLLYLCSDFSVLHMLHEMFFIFLHFSVERDHCRDHVKPSDPVSQMQFALLSSDDCLVAQAFSFTSAPISAPLSALPSFLAYVLTSALNLPAFPSMLPCMCLCLISNMGNSCPHLCSHL
jgi:hypothetical protein